MNALTDLVYLFKNIFVQLGKKNTLAHLCRTFQDSSFCHFSATIYSNHAGLFILNNSHAHFTSSHFTLSFIFLISNVFVSEQLLLNLFK